MRYLHSCLESVKSFFDAYFSLPKTLYFTYTISLFTHMVHAFIALSKLTLFEHNCWDTSYAQQTLDLSEILQQLAERFEEAGTEFHVNSLSLQRNDCFTRVARKILKIKTWFDSKQAAGSGQEDIQEENRESVVVDKEMMAVMQFDLLDEALWLDAMIGWETLQ
jgi:hypothetical protein